MGDFDSIKIDYDEHTITDFINNVHSFDTTEEMIATVGISRHRTSSRNGILKIDATLQVAEIMQRFGINTVEDFRKNDNKEELDKSILKVRGQKSGTMLKYLYMLAGDPNRCKPDRHLLRFLAQYYPSMKSEEADEIIEQTVAVLKKENPLLSVRMLDNAIWNKMRS